MSGETRLLWTVTRGGETLGYVAIDTLVGGRAQGGLRLLPDVDEAELRGLARAMTLKYGFLGLPQGGAKAGVRGDPDAPLGERRARLRAFGEAIAPLLRQGIYVPGTDMGTDNDDIRALLAAAGAPARRRQSRGADSGDYTALTVFAGVQAALRHGGAELAGRAVAIEGFGKVGAALARLVAGAGGRVVAISTSRGALHEPDGLDVPRLLAVAGAAGSAVVDEIPEARRLEREALLELPVDVLCPCARHNSIHAGNAPRAPRSSRPAPTTRSRPRPKPTWPGAAFSACPTS